MGPAFGNAHERREPTNVWQGSLELSIVILPLQERPRRRSLRTVQHNGPCQAEGHCGGVGQDGSRSEQEAGRYKNTLCILVDSAVVHYVVLNQCRLNVPVGCVLLRTSLYKYKVVFK